MKDAVRRSAKSATVIWAVRPYVRRALYDPDLRDTARSAYDSGRRIYDALSGERPGKAVEKLAGSKKLQREVRDLVASLRAAVDQTVVAERRRQRRRWLGLALLLGGGAVAAGVAAGKTGQLSQQAGKISERLPWTGSSSESGNGGSPDDQAIRPAGSPAT